MYAKLAQHYDWRSYRRARASRATGRRWGRPCLSCSGGSWLACATAPSSASTNSRRDRRAAGEAERAAVRWKAAGSRPSRRSIAPRCARCRRALGAGAPKKVTVNIDYHVDHEARLSSVPHALVGEAVEMRVTNSVVEIFHRGKRVASHDRLWGPRGSTSTVPEHRPRSHREYGAWPSRIIDWAASIGSSAAALVEQILLGRREPESAYQSCMGLLRSAKAVRPRALRRRLQAPSRLARPPARACWRS